MFLPWNGYLVRIGFRIPQRGSQLLLQHLPLHLRKSRCEQIDELPQRPRLLQRAPHRSRHRIEVVVRVSGRDGGEKGSRRPDEPRCRGRGRKGAASWVDVRYAEVGRMPRSDFAANNIGRGRHCGVAQAETARALDHRDQPVELIRRRYGIGEVLQDQLAGAGEASRNYPSPHTERACRTCLADGRPLWLRPTRQVVT